MRRGSITQRVTLVLVLGLVALLAILVFYILDTSAAAREESRSSALALSDAVTQSCSDKTTSIIKMASSLAQNSYVEAYFSSEGITDRVSSLRIFNSFALNAISDTPDILAVGLIDLDGSSVTLGSLLDATLLGRLKTSYPVLTEEDPFLPFFTDTIRLSGRVPYYAYILPIYDVNSPVPMTRIASLVVLCDQRRLQSLVDQPLTDPFCDVRLYNGDGHPMATRDTALVRSISKLETVTHDIGDSGWQITYYLDFSAFRWQGLSLNLILLAVLVCTAILLSMGLILRASVARPVDAIIEKIRDGKDLSQMGLHFGSELDIIVDTIQTTFADLERSAQERLQNQTKMFAIQLHLRESELSALQSQINHHFLYNTLECMRSIGMYYGSPEIVSISTAMADIFRYSIKGSPMVPLRTELDVINKYLTIINVRFDDRFTAQIDCTPETLDCIIPKMILQPLVENAIYYGLEPKKGPGSLTLRARLHNAQLILLVEDDGVGMEQEELEALRASLSSDDPPLSGSTEKSSIGLTNIANRVRLFAHDRCSVAVHSVKGVGTSVCLTLPSHKDVEIEDDILP